MKLFAPLVRNEAPPMPLSFGSSPVVAGQGTYLTNARAYAANEIVASAIDLLATSAAEPHIIGRRLRREKPTVRNERPPLALMPIAEAKAEVRRVEQALQAKGMPLALVRQWMIRNQFIEELPNHPLVRLLNNPNPFMSRGQFTSTLVMDRMIAGNAYVLKARGALGNVGELWRLRPDRVRVIPGAGYVAGYEYNVGRERITYDASDVMHFKTLNPLNEYYGMPPLLQLLPRVEIDNYMRGFLKTFFERGGAGPGSILTIKQRVSQDAKDDIRDRIKRQFGGSSGWHEMLILDQAESSYQQMGLARGLRDALPKELDAVSEARIAMRFGIPGSILGLLIGYESSSYANKRQDWQVLWDITMTPLLSDMDDTMNLAFRLGQPDADFGGIDEVLYDLSDIKALQEDVDKQHDRHRKNVAGGVEFWEEARDGMGLDPGAEGTLLIPANMIPVRVHAGEIEMPSPPPRQLPSGEPDDVVAEVRHDCGKLIARDVAGNPELHCPKCKVNFRALDKVAVLSP